MRKILLVIIAIIAVLGCVKQIEHIGASKMEDILYDYHRAEASLDNFASDYAYKSHLYAKAVLQKYGVTQAEFDSSMVYYMRHSDELQKIYERIDSRLKDDALNLGADVSDFKRYANLSNNGDTANIWTGNEFYALTTYVPYNKMTFSQKIDTTFYMGDKLIWEFDSKYYFQDGFRNATMLMVAKYANDSIVTQTNNFSGDSHQRLSMETLPDQRLTSLKGFIMLNKGNGQSKTTLKLLFLSDMRLIRIHAKKEEKKDEGEDKNKENTDTITNDEPKPMLEPEN